MEGFHIHIASLLKTFTVCFFPLLLMLALPLMESTALMPTMRHALNGVLEGPASAFLLLNCLIFTIIASSKLEGEKRGLEGESKREVTMGLIEKLADESKGDNIVTGQSHYSDTQVKNGYDENGFCYHKVNGENFARRSCSLNASFDSKPKHEEQVKLNFLNEKKPIIKRARIATTKRNDKVRLHPNKPLSTNLKEKQLSCEGSHTEKPAQANNFDNTADETCTEGLGLTGPQAQNPVLPAATAHPSLEEVWAAIMSSNKRDDCNIQAPNSQNVKQPQPAPAAAASGTPTQQPTTAAAALAIPAEAASSAGKASSAAAAAEKHVEDGNDEENDRELEELNRRAEEFITRFNRQIRLEREESLQRQKRGRRACNNDVQYAHAHALQLPVRGLLVG